MFNARLRLWRELGSVSLSPAPCHVCAGDILDMVSQMTFTSARPRGTTPLPPIYGIFRLLAASIGLGTSLRLSCCVCTT